MVFNLLFKVNVLNNTRMKAPEPRGPAGLNRGKVRGGYK